MGGTNQSANWIAVARNETTITYFDRQERPGDLEGTTPMELDGPTGCEVGIQSSGVSGEHT